jgi:hypothetical protein
MGYTGLGRGDSALASLFFHHRLKRISQLIRAKSLTRRAIVDKLGNWNKERIDNLIDTFGE